jgi:hypothetical protein
VSAWKKTITVTFESEIMTKSINSHTFYLSDGVSRISGTINFVRNSNAPNVTSATFVPSLLLKPGTFCTGTLTMDIKNKHGVSSDTTFTWSFRTGSASDTIPEDTTIVVTDTIRFSEDIIPIFNSNCVVCHKGSTPPDLREAQAYSSLISGGYVIANDAENSELYKALKPGGSMKNYISSNQLALIKRWINAGAKKN